MTRRARKARASADAFAAAIPSPFIQRKLAFYDPLDEEQLLQIDQQVDWMLENIGFAFRDDPEALRIWQEASGDGVKLFGDKVFADAEWVRAQCAKAPKQFTQLGRNPERTVTIGGTNQVFAPIYGAPFARDLEGGRRYA
ncbi:MAG: trimethylamine methyltransferase family protein, partial [Thiolinea sp.]